jgi:hypothetical protein
MTGRFIGGRVGFVRGVKKLEKVAQPADKY